MSEWTENALVDIVLWILVSLIGRRTDIEGNETQGV